MIAVLMYMVHVVLQYATEVNNTILKNLILRFWGKIKMRPLCTQNSCGTHQVLHKNSSLSRNQIFLTSVAYCTQGLHAVLVRVGIMCDFCSYVYPHNVNTIVSI